MLCLDRSRQPGRAMVREADSHFFEHVTFETVNLGNV